MLVSRSRKEKTCHRRRAQTKILLPRESETTIKKLVKIAHHSANQSPVAAYICGHQITNNFSITHAAKLLRSHMSQALLPCCCGNKN